MLLQIYLLPLSNVPTYTLQVWERHLKSRNGTHFPSPQYTSQLFAEVAIYD